MGIHGIYKEIGPGKRIALSKLALEKFEETGRPLRIAIDTSIWLFQIQASKGGTNPALRTFYYRLLRLIALSIHPIFVFDGPNKPPFKRNKRTGPNVASIPEFLAKQLLKQFGYPIHLAPGEAEAECALLQREGIVDAVLSEDVDTLMFGSGITIRNWSPESSSKTPTHVNVYDAIETKNGPSGLDREGMILVALMSGGDYVPEGIPGCGPKTACEAAKAGFGHDLCKIPRNDAHRMREWRERLQHELKTNESKMFKRRHTTLKIPDDFPRLDILGYYTHPAISNQTGLDKLRRSINWDKELDYSGLREFTKDAFDWVKLEGAKHFVRSLAPCMVVRQLRLRSQQLNRLPTENVQAIQEDEALLIKSIHGKRQHPVTDNCTELRVAFTPIELVKIDLGMEDPNDESDNLATDVQQGDVDLDDEGALDLEDDVPKKRGPTKFDPLKPARIWILESFVRIGVPLKVQDWEAGRQAKQKPRRAATTQAPATAAPKAKTGVRRQKTTGDIGQAPIQQFARVTKARSRAAQAVAKAQTAPNRRAPSPTPPGPPESVETLDLIDTSPVHPLPKIFATQQHREASAPLVEIPSSVTKRRRRGPMQRAHTLPTNPSAISDRSTTPPLLDTVETLDLLSSPVLPLPSQFPAKKSKQHKNNIPLVRAFRGSSVASSPSKGKQTTLDAWRASVTPNRIREDGPSNIEAPIPAPPELKPPCIVDEIDLTLSSPRSPQLRSNKSNTTARSRQREEPAIERPPLSKARSRSSSGTSSRSVSNSRIEKPTNRRTSPRLEKNKSVSPELETLDLLSPPPKHAPAKPTSTNTDILDLTLSSSPPPHPVPHPAPIAEPEMSYTKHPHSPSPTAISLRRSPRAHVSTLPSTSDANTSPPAAWKAREKKKRQIMLRKSVAGAWDFVEVDSRVLEPEEVLKGKDRRRWRESEVEVLDLS